MIYTETGGIFLYIARNFPHLLHESYVLFVASSVPTFVFLLFSLLFFIPLLNILRFIIPIDIFYSSTIELIADIVLISMSNWIYCLFIGILALLFIYNSSVIPFDGCYSQSSLFSKGRLLLHRHFTMVSFSSDRRLSEYIELEFLEAHTILDSIQSAAVKLENSRFLNIPQINRNGGTKIRNYDIVAYFRSLWNYYLTIYTLSFRYHEIAFSLCRILSYFAKVQNYATRCDADLLKVPTLFESLLERERFIEKYCQINLESNEHAEHFKRSVKLF
ncbi:hypothetical protein PAEPH01_1763 [Pancytospora epiphaga]|nr:hypothetical protein PAEPH01_1763 [Pancytospora epiphaga]